MKPFENIYSITEPQAALEYITDLLTDAIDKHAPIRKKRIKHPDIPGWLRNPDIIKAMKTRDAYKKTKQIEQFKKQRNLVNKMVRKAKKSYFNEIIKK